MKYLVVCDRVSFADVPEVVTSLPGHGITVKAYITTMFQYGKGYSGAGTDTMSAQRVVRPHAVENEETGPGHLQVRIRLSWKRVYGTSV